MIGSENMLYGVPLLKNTGQINSLFANIEAVIGYWHPDLRIPPYRHIHAHLGTFIKDGKKIGSLTKDAGAAIKAVLQDEIGVEYLLEVDCNMADIKRMVDGKQPVILTINDCGPHSVIVIGIDEGDVYYTDPFQPTEQNKWIVENWGCMKVELSEFERSWYKDMLIIRNKPAYAYTNQDSLLIRHYREEHHGYQE